MTSETVDVWTHDGDALAGFCGTVGGDTVLGLMVREEQPAPYMVLVSTLQAGAQDGFRLRKLVLRPEVRYDDTILDALRPHVDELVLETRSR